MVGSPSAEAGGCERLFWAFWFPLPFLRRRLRFDPPSPWGCPPTVAGSASGQSLDSEESSEDSETSGAGAGGTSTGAEDSAAASVAGSASLAFACFFGRGLEDPADARRFSGLRHRFLLGSGGGFFAHGMRQKQAPAEVPRREHSRVETVTFAGKDRFSVDSCLKFHRIRKFLLTRAIHRL